MIICFPQREQIGVALNFPVILHQTQMSRPPVRFPVQLFHLEMEVGIQGDGFVLVFLIPLVCNGKRIAILVLYPHGRDQVGILLLRIAVYTFPADSNANLADVSVLLRLDGIFHRTEALVITAVQLFGNALFLSILVAL